MMEECRSIIDISSDCYTVELPKINLLKNKYSEFGAICGS